jgi:hypothetical protein
LQRSEAVVEMLFLIVEANRAFVKEILPILHIFLNSFGSLHPHAWSIPVVCPGRGVQRLLVPLS